MLKAIITTLAILTATSACSSIKDFLYKDKCTSGEWETLGDQDGQTGQGNIGTWTERCKAYNTTPNTKQYEAGVQKGMQKYCYNSGMDLAKQGTSMNVPSKCTEVKLKEQYQQGYTMGIGEFCSESKAREVGLAGQARHESCTKLKPYATAYNDGLAEFCSSKRAYTAGTEGQTYDAANCTEKQKAALTASFNRGTKLRETKAAIGTLEAEITDLQKKMYDPSTPADAKTHYQSILATKQGQLKAAEREMYKMENTRI